MALTFIGLPFEHALGEAIPALEFFGVSHGLVSQDKSPFAPLNPAQDVVESFGEVASQSASPEEKETSDVYARYFIRAKLSKAALRRFGPLEFENVLLDIQASPYAASPVTGDLYLWKPHCAHVGAGWQPYQLKNKEGSVQTGCRFTLKQGLIAAKKPEALKRSNSPRATNLVDVAQQIENANVDPREKYSLMFEYRKANGSARAFVVLSLRPRAELPSIAMNPHHIYKYRNNSILVDVPPRIQSLTGIRKIYAQAGLGLEDSLVASPLTVHQNFEFGAGSLHTTLEARYVASRVEGIPGHYAPLRLRIDSRTPAPRKVRLLAFKLFTYGVEAGEPRVVPFGPAKEIVLRRGQSTLDLNLTGAEPNTPQALKPTDAYVLLYVLATDEFAVSLAALRQGPVLFVDPEPLGGLFPF